MKYNNPIVRGFNPDPSVCRVQDDFYMVTSTFELFPGVPVYHSKNLVNWTLIGHCLTRESQLPLRQAAPSMGIYAPTIRYHDGVFYMTTTNCSGQGNLIVHAADPAGAWSEPVYVDQGGIDPSLFWDDDGRCYFCSNPGAEGKWGIAGSQINPLTGEKLSLTTHLCEGSGGRYAEAPHIFKRNGLYYLLMAEGGTEYGHMVTLFRADTPLGPYREACPHNPILSHRDLGGSPIQCTGHADLFDDHSGESWLVCLGVRPLPGRQLHHLGRETFLSPVRWTDDGWPVVGEEGHIAPVMDGPLPAPIAPQCFDFSDDFLADTLRPQWVFLRNPDASNYRPIGGAVRLFGTDAPLTGLDSPTLMMVRQPEAELTVDVILARCAAQEAGLVAFYNMDYLYAFYREGGRMVLRRRVHGMDSMLSLPLGESATEEVHLRMFGADEAYHFSFSTDGVHYTQLGSAPWAGLCTETTQMCTFTGTMIGLFAIAGEADFSCFALRCGTPNEAR